MWFKQMSVFLLPADYSLSAAELQDALAANPLQPCGTQEMQRVGWVAAGPRRPVGDEVLPLLHTVQGQHLLALGIEEKLLPTAIIRQQADERAAQIEAAQGHPPGRRQLRELREQVADELRARALTRRRSLRAWLDVERRRLVIDNASAARAEQFLAALRDTLLTFNAPPLTTRQIPQQAMATWLRSGHAAPGFSIDEDLELRAAVDARHCVRYAHHPIDSGEVRDYLDAGLVPTRLGMTWRDRIAFVLSDALQLRRLQFVGMSGDEGEGVAVEERFDNDFALMAGETAQLLDELTSGLGGQAE